MRAYVIEGLCAGLQKRLVSHISLLPSAEYRLQYYNTKPFVQSKVKEWHKISVMKIILLKSITTPQTGEIHHPGEEKVFSS